MRSLFGALVTFLAIILFGAYAWNQMRHATLVAPAVPPQTTAVAEPKPPEDSFDPQREAQQAVKYVGPLANYMGRQQESDPPQANSTDAQIETLSEPRKPHPADLVGYSVVGTTMPVLQSTFRVRRAVQVPFEVPAHAATPRLKGSYRSFVNQPADSESEGKVEFLVLNEQQYSDFLEKRSGEAVFAADEAQHQEVNAHLPPTLGQPQKYHLLFRNNSKATARKFVQADFHMEF